MAEIKGTNIVGAITPFTTDDTYPTHYAKYGHGGYRTVGTIDEMNSIPEARCENGMLVYVTEEDKIYKYNDTDKKFYKLALGGSGAAGEYTAGTNIDITDDVISAVGYTYDKTNKNFSIGEVQSEILLVNDRNLLTWSKYLGVEGENTESTDIIYTGATEDINFKDILSIGDFVVFEDPGQGSRSEYNVIDVEGSYFTIDGVLFSAPENTDVYKFIGGNSFFAQNNGDIYVKGIGSYNGADTTTCASLQDAFNELNNNLEELNSSLNNTSYTGGDNIYISNEGKITAKGYDYVNGEVQFSKVRMKNGSVFHFAEASGLTSKYSEFNIVDTPITITKTNSSPIVNLVGVEVKSDSNMTTSGSISAAQGFYETSDARKKNIIDELPLDKAYELINNCQSIIYTLKDSTDKQQIGLIAQEVQQYFPEVVSEDKDGYLSLDYAKLTSVIFRVLKDVIDRLNKLENK